MKCRVCQYETNEDIDGARELIAHLRYYHSDLIGDEKLSKFIVIEGEEPSVLIEMLGEDTEGEWQGQDDAHESHMVWGKSSPKGHGHFSGNQQHIEGEVGSREFSDDVPLLNKKEDPEIAKQKEFARKREGYAPEMEEYPRHPSYRSKQKNAEGYHTYLCSTCSHSCKDADCHWRHLLSTHRELAHPFLVTYLSEKYLQKIKNKSENISKDEVLSWAKSEANKVFERLELDGSDQMVRYQLSELALPRQRAFLIGHEDLAGADVCPFCGTSILGSAAVDLQTQHVRNRILDTLRKANKSLENLSYNALVETQFPITWNHEALQVSLAPILHMALEHRVQFLSYVDSGLLDGNLPHYLASFFQPERQTTTSNEKLSTDGLALDAVAYLNFFKKRTDSKASHYTKE